MAILNENYDFMRDAPPDALAAFRFPPRKTLFPSSAEFMRMITAENQKTGDRGNETFGSPWWFTKAIFQEIVKLSDPKNLGISEVARIGLAVPREFNPKMDWVCIIYLTQSAYGWVGKAGRQLASPSASIYLGGGKEQVFLPNLVQDRSAIASDYARMRFFGMCPDYF